ncbi:MAG: radical SAM protein [Lachnospiraceae bacterium]|nr:radical SAM protein [Lachnospiraceae bacterium]
MITLQRPDPKVGALLGENKGIREGCLLRPSQFALPLIIGGRKVVWNTFTRQCIETEYFFLFQPETGEPSQIRFDPADREMSALVRCDFLVKEGIDEADRFEKVLTLLRRMTKRKDGYLGYTILPTTACNARCVYCYEEGIAPESMTEDVIEETVRYIESTCRKGAPIELHWFGGEPMAGEKTIDRICGALRGKGVDYRSSMISNGSLITPARAKKMREDWRLQNIQITLDGREDMYCARKRYKDFPGSPYRAVLDGIRALLEQRVRVNIRLNVEEENLQEMHALVEELSREFADETGIRLYAHSIFVEEGDVRERDDAAFYDAMEELEKTLRAFNRKRMETGEEPPSGIDSIVIREEREETDAGWEELSGAGETSGEKEKSRKKERPYDRVGHLKRYYCMADDPAAGPVIKPGGECCLCEHVSDAPVVGTVFSGQRIRREAHPAKTRLQDARCRACPFLPVCTDFVGCPAVCRDCRREMLALEKRALEALADEERLPPVLLAVGGEKVLVTEPTREFAERNLEITLPGYYRADRVVRQEEAAI